ncbi:MULTISPECIES: hypothetical protein [unclassified Variovorax]|uniref:hypothetical protein n=1 Tax=unclassified Variovorax TaxID=663243 RepID=UPI00076C4893|nr:MULTISPECIES: hypothetical protein [unclassified Variovorax]KWT98043.1 hypothetical protein APY03_0714 [Variovorax sp. WDL1]PNG50483.1 hypothetical protein CHC06_06107 [Variovorax sp. B2]PNG51356.1 hypothetical protein CHC07_06013 [Variovorax sp. B4]VTV17626.1 hypothetical protein WDL1P1_00541 [Variovorax sp. WDL1]
MSATPATLVIDQAFSAYLAYSTAPTEAALLELLAELKMLDETLALTANRNTFLAFPEYQALNALLDHARYVGMRATSSDCARCSARRLSQRLAKLAWYRGPIATRRC